MKNNIAKVISIMLIFGVIFTGCSTSKNNNDKKTDNTSQTVVSQLKSEVSDVMKKVAWNDPKSVATSYLHINHIYSPQYTPYSELEQLASADLVKHLKENNSTNLKRIKTYNETSKFISATFTKETKNATFTVYNKQYVNGEYFEITVTGTLNGKQKSMNETIVLINENGKWKVVGNSIVPAQSSKK